MKYYVIAPSYDFYLRAVAYLKSQSIPVINESRKRLILTINISIEAERACEVLKIFGASIQLKERA